MVLIKLCEGFDKLYRIFWNRQNNCWFCITQTKIAKNYIIPSSVSFALLWLNLFVSHNLPTCHKVSFFTCSRSEIDFLLLVNTGLISEMEHSIHILLVYEFYFLNSVCSFQTKQVDILVAKGHALKIWYSIKQN